MTALRLFLLLSVCFIFVAAPAMADNNIAGDWSGVATGLGARLVFHISGGGGYYTATTDSAVRGNGLPTKVTEDQANNVFISVAISPKFDFSGVLNGNIITGTWSRNGQSGRMTLTRAQDASAAPSSVTNDNGANAAASNDGPADGEWTGTLEGLGVTFVLHVTGPISAYSATSDIAALGKTGIATEFSVDSSNNVTIGVTSQNFSFTGVMNGNQMTGNWNRGPISGALTLTRTGGGPAGSASGGGSTGGPAAAKDPLDGDWTGVLQGPGSHLVVHIGGVDGSYTATSDTPDQNATKIPSAFNVDANNNVSLTVSSSANITITGVLSGNTITGTWSQNGATGTITLTQQVPIVPGSTPGASSGGLAGTWTGTISGLGVGIVVHIAGSPGNYSAKSDIVALQQSGIPTSITVDSNNNVVFSVSSLSFTYNGVASGNKISGTWSRSGSTGTLNLTKGP
jgi:hypothetical protein